MKFDLQTMQHIKVIQVNLRSSWSVTLELIEYIRRNDIDIALLQEPYSKIATQKSHFTEYQLVAHKSLVKACILVKNNLDILCDQNIQLEHHTLCYVKQINSFVVSSYFQSKDSTERHTTLLTEMIDKIETNADIIIGMDSNAHSHLWYSESVDDRGRKVESFINEKALVIMNRMGQPYTFRSHIGSSNIDITLATKKIARKICDWQVEERATTSDHNAITFNIVSEENNLDHDKMQIDIPSFNWRRFNGSMIHIVDNLLEKPCDTIEGIELICTELEKEMIIAIEENGRRKRYQNKSFWNKDLHIMKRSITKLLSQLSKCYSIPTIRTN